MTRLSSLLAHHHQAADNRRNQRALQSALASAPTTESRHEIQVLIARG